ncbi:hypothetical protein Tco_0647451 [Tanacetum coccineum]
MAINDMDLYYSRLIHDDLNELIIKYKILRDLHPRLPLEEFVMPELLDNAIGIYHRMFDFSGVRIPFSSFLLALIKYYWVHFSQLGPLGLNKVITFEAILDSMVWRHPSAAIDDPRPAAGSFSMADVRRLNAHVIKLRDMPEGVLVLSGLSHVWKSRICDLVSDVRRAHHDIRADPNLRLPFYYTPPAAADIVISDPTLADLAAGTHSANVLAKGEAFQKRKASTSGATSSHVDKCTRYALILLVTPLRSAAVIPSLGNQGGSFATPTAEGSNPQDSRGKVIMDNDAVAPSVGVSRPRPSSRHATYPEVGIAGNYEFIRKEWDAPYQHTFGVLTKEVFKDPAVCKTVVDYFPTPREMVQYVLLADSRLEGYEEKVASLSVLELQVSTLKKQVFGLNDKLSSFDSSFAKSKAKGKERKKKIKSLTKKAEKDKEILRLKATPPEFSSFFRGQFHGLVWNFLASDEFSRVQGKLLSLAASAGFERGLSMHQTKDEFVVVLKKMANFMPGINCGHCFPKSLEFSTNVAPAPFAVTLEQNEEWVDAMVDGPDAKMTDGPAPSKSEGSERVSSGLTDVVVALSAGEKGDGSLPSSAVDEEGRVVCRRTLAAPSLGQTDYRCVVVVHPADPELLLFPSSLVVTCSLHDVVVHQSCLLGRRGSPCLLLRPHAKVFVFNLAFPYVFHLYGVALLSANLNRATVLEAKRDEEILFLKATPPEFSSFFQGQFQGLVWKFLAFDEFSRVQGELLSLAASAGFERGLSMHWTKDEFVAMLKKMANCMPGLEPEKLAHPANVPTSRDVHVSPPIAKESTVTLASKSFELSTNVVPAPSVVALEQHEESVFVQGISHVLDDVAEVTVVGSECVSSSPTNVVVALSVGEKGDGSLPSSIADEEAAANPSRV